MNNNKPHFWQNRSQRNGVLYLAISIVLLQLFYLFFNFSSDEIVNFNTPEIIQFQERVDSLKVIAIANRKPKIFPFNPSFITDYKGYRLGMKTEEIDRLLTYRSKGKYINSAHQFQQVTKISDSLLKQLKPYFKFPNWINNKKQSTKGNKTSSIKFTGVKKNFNLVSETELKLVNGIGEKLSTRIVKFRTSLGGFKNINQVKKIYGLKPEVIDRLFERFYLTTITSGNQTRKIATNQIIDLNLATASQLKNISGIGEKLSARIIKFRDNLGGFYFEDQLQEVYGLKPEVIERLFKEFEILSKPNIKKININEATFKEILHLPYIDYKLTKKIFEYKDEFAEFQDLEELKKIDSFPLNKYERIVLYLTTKFE